MSGGRYVRGDAHMGRDRAGLLAPLPRAPAVCCSAAEMVGVPYALPSSVPALCLMATHSNRRMCFACTPSPLSCVLFLLPWPPCFPWPVTQIAIMKALNHKNIVNLREVLSSRTKLYIVMDLVRGGELFEMIENRGELDEVLARKYFQQLIDGIDYCHRRGVCHRDLKVRLVFVCWTGQRRGATAYCLDGVWLSLPPRLTRTADLDVLCSPGATH